MILIQSFESARGRFLWSSVSDDLFFSSCSFWFSIFSHLIISLSFLSSSISEALFALSFSFLSERLLLLFVHTKAALVYVTGFAKTGLIAGVRNYSYSPFSSAK